MAAEYTLHINGRDYVTSENKSILRYLRDDLHLTSVKDGCSEGACGTCTIIVDNRAVKSCVLTTKLAQGHDIVTIEGLTEREQEAFVYAFGAAGAVQCGFCIPGIIMSAMEMVDSGKTFTRDEIRKNLSGHLCRCTGYQNVIDGVEKAIEIVHGECGTEE